RFMKHNTKSYSQRFLLPVIVVFAVCLFLCHPAFAHLSESTISISSANDQNQSTGILTLQASLISPRNGDVLVNFPANLEVKVTRGGVPVEGARVQFWMEGGSTDAAMHNAGLTMTNSSGYANLVLQNQNTLDPGQYIWYATATKKGFKGGSSQTFFFVIPSNLNNVSNSFGTVSTDKKEYSIVEGNVTSVIIFGNVNNYHLGQPISLSSVTKWQSNPSGYIWHVSWKISNCI
ncbi:MAG: hypothetical protein KGI25_02625, partial [Thaumarchaeota archaeon]|nr:hypothetical protein [Nitrososphaerota archaeon]